MASIEKLNSDQGKRKNGTLCIGSAIAITAAASIGISYGLSAAFNAWRDRDEIVTQVARTVAPLNPMNFIARPR